MRSRSSGRTAAAVRQSGDADARPVGGSRCVARTRSWRPITRCANGGRHADHTAIARADVGGFWRDEGETGERLLLAHPVSDAAGELVGVMLIARNVEYLEPGPVDHPLFAQAGGARPAVGRCRARSEEPAERDDDPPRAAAAARRASGARRRRRRVGACDRSASTRRRCGGPTPQALQHVDIIAQEIRRLDEVVQGFLKFTRPEDLKLQPVNLAALFDEIVPIIRPEAEQRGVGIVVDAERRARRERRSGDAAPGDSQPGVERLPGDADGGTLRLRCESARRPAREDHGRGHRRRHQARAPAADLRSVLHHQGAGQRHRPVDGLSHRSDARRRD